MEGREGGGCAPHAGQTVGPGVARVINMRHRAIRVTDTTTFIPRAPEGGAHSTCRIPREHSRPAGRRDTGPRAGLPEHTSHTHTRDVL
ncbi:hypothetical protein E2C01_065245 [Portunus trituberculatus]|uniref:Uncharacterized protein n=1 Tax=Portunus trituberculatus TaxID=210409 RepID=A0A5B7HQJ0_PORTR|nr:hypothetical protein [Portunus trituberculatus]